MLLVMSLQEEYGLLVLGFSMQCQQKILDNIFGKRQGDMMFEGLVDSVDVNTFDRKLKIMV